MSGERPEAHTLLGPYVMDALDSKDRARFERHLARCQECTTEVGSLREAAGCLAAATCSQPDAAAKEQVLAELPRTRQLGHSSARPEPGPPSARTLTEHQDQDRALGAAHPVRLAQRVQAGR